MQFAVNSIVSDQVEFLQWRCTEELNKGSKVRNHFYNQAQTIHFFVGDFFAVYIFEGESWAPSCGLVKAAVVPIYQLGKLRFGMVNGSPGPITNKW